MKKKSLLLAILVCAGALCAGCASSSGSSSSDGTTYGDYVTLGEYKGLDVTMIKTEVTDDMLEEEIEYFLEENATYTEITERGAEEGDIVNVDYEGTIDGEEFDYSSDEDYEIVLGDGYLQTEIEDEIVGMMAGETKDITVTLSEDYFDEEDAGQEAVFSVTVNSIYLEEIPEYTDEFIASVTDYSTTAEYEEALSEELYITTEEDNRYTAGMDALAMVVEEATFNGYPDELYDSCKDEYDALNEMYAELFGIDVSELEEDEEDAKSSIEEMVYEEMVCVTIAELEGIEVTDEDYEQYLEDNYELYGYESTEEYEEYETKDAIMDEILTEMVQDFLVDNANITEVTEDEYYESYDDEYYYEDDTDYYEDETDTEDVTE